MANIIPVILAGGSGTRLWPLSREAFPKQFLQLVGDDSLLQATVRRARDMGLAEPMMITQAEHRFVLEEQLIEKNLGPAQLVLEPVARNTGIAIAAAAHLALQRSHAALLLVLPADHVIQDTQAWMNAIHMGIPAAMMGQLITFGITPRFAATGYGYIAQGAAIEGAPGAYQVLRFVEKPDAERAEQYVQSGAWLWNSGMFLMRADNYLLELEQYAPKIAEAAKASVAKAVIEKNHVKLDAAAYELSPSRSIDHAVMEHTQHAGVVPCDLGWSDIGSWSALWDIGDKDENQNVLFGDIITHATENCYIRTEKPLVATYGLQDAVVVATPDVVMVSSRHQPQEIKAIIEKLREAKRAELTDPRRMHRPWGSYETIIDGAGFKVKKISVKPGCRLSLQSHKHRSEHWVVVSGIADIEINDIDSQIKIRRTPNTSVYVPKGALHRLANNGEEMLELIEVQCGDYLGEDDIERFSDDYGRN